MELSQQLLQPSFLTLRFDFHGLANRPIKRPRLMWSTVLVANDQKIGMRALTNATQLNEGFYEECRGVFFGFLLECALLSCRLWAVT